MIDDSTETDVNEAEERSLTSSESTAPDGILTSADAEALAELLLGPWPGESSEVASPVPNPDDRPADSLNVVETGQKSLFGTVIDIRSDEATVTEAAAPLFPTVAQAADADPTVASGPLFASGSGDDEGLAAGAVGFVPADHVEVEPQRRRLFLVGLLLLASLTVGALLVLLATGGDGSDVATVEEVDLTIVSPTTEAPAALSTTSSTRRSTTTAAPTSVTTTAPTSVAAAPDPRPVTTRRPATTRPPSTTVAPTTTEVSTTDESGVTFAAPTWTATTTVPTTAAPTTAAPTTAAPTTAAPTTPAPTTAAPTTAATAATSTDAGEAEG